MKFGVIDCGTNTFNLLIVRIDGDGNSHTIFKNKIIVKLAPSHTTGQIGKNRFARAIDALYVQKNILINLDVRDYQIVATSAIRDSENGEYFVQTVKEKLHLNVQIISGDEEASLIFKGISSSKTSFPTPYVIMDIGGGSVEFIVYDGHKNIWQKSLPIGVSRLKGEFRPSDPIEASTINRVHEKLDKSLEESMQTLTKHKVTTLVGSSGSFDTLVKLIHTTDSESRREDGDHEIYMDELRAVFKKILLSTFEEKLKMKGIPVMRADMINFAVILIDYVLHKTNIQHVYHSDFALKEGIVQKRIESLRLEQKLNRN